MIGPLGSANREIRRAEERDEQRRLARLAEPRRLTDQLLDHLEELNLDGRGTVPQSYEAALSALRHHLSEWPRVSPRLLDRLQPGGGISDLIDTIFSIQEIISPPTLATPPLPLGDDDEAG
jgi:hypothetical protein